MELISIMDNILTIFNDLSKTPDTYMLQIAQREKVIRKKEKLSRAELSEKSGVSRTMISQLETSQKVDCKVSTLLAVSNALGYPVGEIFLPDEFTTVNS